MTSMNRRRCLGLSLLTLCAACGGGNGAGSAQAAATTDNSGATAGTLRELTSTQLAAQMGVGWNLGNALEAIGGETAWGNAKTTQALIDAVAAAGFKTVRIPVAWQQYTDASGTIQASWLARVTEVVGYAHKAGLYAIINVHWDGGWLQPTLARQAQANARLASFWTQIATHFRQHGDTLLFAGTNEVMVEGDWGPPTADYAAVQNGFNQVFVDAVRATGGNNARRHLVVQGFNTNIEHTLARFTRPRDSASDRLMLEVHYYDPYHFTIDEASALWQWGAGTTDAKAADTWGNEDWADAQFQKIKTRFADQGLPVIVGEYGVIARPAIAGSERYRQAWNAHVTRAARSRGLVPIYWDNGATGDKGMGLFHRAGGAQAHPDLIRAIVEAGR